MTTTQISRTVDTLSVGMPKHWRALSLYPLYRHDTLNTRRNVDVMPAAQALHGGGLQISEVAQATVPTLTATNQTGRLVFFIAGEMVFGGRQDRMVTDSFLLPPGEWEIPVACVESGRWGGGTRFELRTGLGPRQVRKGPIMGRGHERVDQGQVWESVGQVLSDAGTPHRTQSLRAALDGGVHDVQHLADMGPLPGQCGVAIGRGRHVIGVELFTSRAVLASYWAAIIASYAPDNVGAYDGRPSMGSVLRFIRRAVLCLEPTPGIGYGSQWRTASAKVAANALLTEPTLADPSTLIHLAVLAALCAPPGGEDFAGGRRGTRAR